MDTKLTAVTLLRVGPNSRMSQAVIANGFVFLSGQVATNDSTDVSSQTREVLSKIDKLLAQAQSDKSKIVSANVFLADMSDFAAMNAIWDEWIPTDAAPARATVGATLAFPNLRVEIQLVALTSA